MKGDVEIWRPLVVIITLITTTVYGNVGGKPQVEYTVEENVGVGYVLGNIGDDLVINPQLPRTYQVVDDEYNLIDINNNGVVSFITNVDREIICSVENDKLSPHKCEYNMNAAIMYQDGVTSPTFFAIKLTIEDLNDNPPTFDRSEIIKTISENAQIGSVIRLTSATDDDVGINDVSGYQLISDDDTFSLHNISNTFGLLIPELYLERKLDREVVTSYEMKIRCFDGGYPQLYGDVTVKVFVTDVNDNAPHFTTDEYQTDVKESELPGKQIIQVQATDDDDGNNAIIKYEFSADSTGKENFRINETTGWIILSRKLDYEKSKTHHLSVVASDIGGNPLQAFATVTIKVINVNDEAPQIRVKFLNEIEIIQEKPRTIRLSEDAVVGKQIAFVTLTDAGGEQVECELHNADDVTEKPYENDVVKLLLEPLEQNSYLLRVSKPLDREEDRVLTIRITAHDNGVPQKTNFTILRIVLDDINDNPPTFPSDVIYVGVNESAIPGDVIASIRAKDLDDGDNKKISYSWQLIDHNNHYATNDDVTKQFIIEKDTGIIKLASSGGGFDAEEMISSYLFNLTATDHGKPRLHSSTLVNISVIDVNDNQPTFIDDPYIFTIDENIHTNHIVGVIHAIDHDMNKLTNGKIDYSLQSCPQQTCPFNIEQSTGEILFTGDSELIDREIRPTSNFNFIVQASDRGKIPKKLQKQTTVEVIINDVNDNVAVVTSPNYQNQFAHISIGQLSDPQSREQMSDDVINDVLIVGFGRKTTRPTSFPINILRMEVEDIDKNVTITYDVIDGDDYNKFQIDEKSGKLQLNIRSQYDLHQLTEGCHVIVVAVHDRGLPHDHVIQAPVNIYVEKGTTEKKNSSEILLECSKSIFYPQNNGNKNGKIGKNPKVTQVTLLVIIFGSILLFLVIIMVVMILKYRCRSNKHHRSYNCKDANEMYHQTHTHPNHSSVERHSRMENFYTDENGRQLHLQQVVDKRGSPPSDEGGRDSGTGDSMPHPTLDGEYIDDATKQLIYQQQRHPQLLRHHATSPTYQQQQTPVMMMTSRCTEECQINGHGDDCWMPMETNGDQYEMIANGNEMVELHHPYMTSQYDPQIRYHHHTTPYYYDPVSNFDNQQQQQSVATSSINQSASYRNSPIMMTSQQQQDYQSHYPLHSTSLLRHQQRSSIRSPQPPPSTAGSGGVRYVQGKAYVNLQGNYDDVCSSNGSANYRIHPTTTTPSIYDDDERALMTSYVDGYYDGGGGGGGYDDSQFTAANLLISPMAPPTGDNHQLATSSPSPSSTNNDVTPTTLAPATGDDVIPGDKLSTIREEIDAEEVVAQIDGLLL